MYKVSKFFDCHLFYGAEYIHSKYTFLYNRKTKKQEKVLHG